LLEATKTQQKNKLKVISLKALKTNQKLHDGHALQKRAATQFCKVRLGKKIIQKWNYEA
jgi:hypothetical protein